MENDNDLLLTSGKDNSNLTLKQLGDISELEIFSGSLEPMRGWQSTVLTEINPITSLNFYQEGKNVEFETSININLIITSVEKSQQGGIDIYEVTFDNGSSEKIEISNN